MIIVVSLIKSVEPHYSYDLQIAPCPLDESTCKDIQKEADELVCPKRCLVHPEQQCSSVMKTTVEEKKKKHCGVFDEIRQKYIQWFFLFSSGQALAPAERPQLKTNSVLEANKQSTPSITCTTNTVMKWERLPIPDIVLNIIS